MAKSDFYLKSAAAQMQAIQTARANALAELEQHRQNKDKYAAGQAVQQLADLAAAQENLQRLANQYVQSQQPAPPLSEEQRRAKPWDQMDFSDSLEMARQSRYAKNLTADDPNFVAGMREAMARRSRGE